MSPSSLYDLYLGDITDLQGYRVRNLSRDSAPLVAPRFSSGDQGQTDLDLLRSVSVDNFSGGMFQRDWTDKLKVARSIGVFNPGDQKLYPSPPRSSTTAVATHYPIAKAEGTYRSAFVMGYFLSGTYYNALYTVTAASGVSSLALPAALASNFSTNIHSLCFHKGYLFVAGVPTTGGGPNLHRYSFTAGTWQDISGNGDRFFTVRGALYLLNYIGEIYAVTNETAAGSATYTLLDQCGIDTAYSTDAQEFNGAAWIAKADGIFRFDGVKAVKVLSLQTNQLQVFNGALYFVSGAWLYRFDGTNVTRIQFFGSDERIGTTNHGGLGLAANSDYLFVTTTVLTAGYTIGDKPIFGSAAPGYKRIYTYDGAAWNLLHESTETFGTYYSAGVLTVGTQSSGLKLYDIFGNQGASTTYASFDMSSVFSSTAVTSSSRLEITTAEHDAGYPNILKSAELVDLSYTGLGASDSIAVSYQIFDGKTWGSWQALGTITSSSGNTLEIQNNLPKIYRRIKISAIATLAAGSTLSLKGISLRWTLQPRVRWRWQTTIMAGGNDSVKDRAGTLISGDANAFNNSIIKSIKQKTPIFMLSPDYGLVKTQINAAATSFIVKGRVPIYTDPYSEYSLVAVKNNNSVWEVLRVSTVTYDAGADETTIAVVERGYQGVTAAQINANAEFHLAYRVYATRLLRDAPILDDNTYTQQSTGESQLQREFQLELVEV